ncbi:MAG: RNA pseudouridine synthase [Litorilituus sp.]|jgi:tRNA pseudouridine32 synthase/23S rRNA pseudouridine746 synthase|nr:RNA pseudouridine synthase [Litorilituus sp.]
MSAIFEHHITFDNTHHEHNKTAITLLFDSLEGTPNSLTKAQIKQAINKGALWLTRGKHTQRLRRVKKTMQQGEKLHFYYNHDVLNTPVPEATLISDETNYSVWYKPYGMLSQGSKWSDHCTISRFAQQYFTPERPAFIVHRLDRAATGIILIAHTKKAARALSTMFELHQLQKHYQVIVHGNHSKRSQPEIISTDIDGKSASSTFTCLAYNQEKDQSLVEVKIDSGRKHQIRKHAASIGLPIVGDRLHGIADHHEQRNLQLSAVKLSFACPISQQAKHFEINHELKPLL